VCGICGFVGNIENKETVLKSMMQAMKHRGPDSDGTYITDDVALGFCRLSIIDLENGAQPMHNEDKSMTLVFNGEIYNFQTLRENLKEEGHQFANRSDSEVLLHGFESYDTALLDHLRGMFAFSLWDEEKKKLFSARDFFGIKPYYYSLINGCFVFASEIKCILQFPGYKKEVNEEALEQYLSFQYSGLHETFFKGIYRLAPGSYLTYENNSLNIEKYYNANLMPSKTADIDDRTKQIDEILKESVKTHMISDVEIGAFLSGGVDSSYIAQQFTGNKAFTVGFFDDKNKYSEIGRAHELAEHLKLEHHTKVISKEEYWEAVPKVMYHLDEPSGDASSIALYFVAREASKHVKVVTSGEGADEFFGGYNIYKEPSALKWVSWLPKSTRRSMAKTAKKLPNVKGKNYLIRAGKDVEERFIGNAFIFSNKARRKLLKRNTGAQTTKELLSGQYKKAAKLSDMEKMQQIDINNWLPGDILQKADRMSMAHSLELRVPYLDKEVFEVARRLPTKAKIKNGQTKYLFRKVVEKYIPKTSADAKKLGFPVPIRVWINDEDWNKEIKATFKSKAAEQFFHTGELVKLLEQHGEKKDNSRKIWTIYSFLVWHKVFFEAESV